MKKRLKEFYQMISIMILTTLSQEHFLQTAYHPSYYHFSILSVGIHDIHLINQEQGLY